jgi:hypothetical protein
MARQQVLVEDLIRQEEARFIDTMGDLEAQRSAERNAEQEIDSAITRMRDTVSTAYPSISTDELNRRLTETRLTLRRQVGLEPASSRQSQIQRSPSEESFSSKNINAIIVMVLALLAICVGGLLFGAYIADDWLTTTDQPAETESDVIVSILATPLFNNIEADITIAVDRDVDEVILYRNTSVVNKWNKGTIFSSREVHTSGTYVYFAEVFKDNRKTTSNQVQVVYGQPKEEAK